MRWHDMTWQNMRNDIYHYYPKLNKTKIRIASIQDKTWQDKTWHDKTRQNISK